ncbi:MAG TPA: cysteine peptidase family C39 domain-containing protein [Candidatus Saccharimonadales bacterium]|nr:cysteine peptidase family C39 domain-containing protein [Candidatus Saccharimonadales bacterium]
MDHFDYRRGDHHRFGRALNAIFTHHIFRKASLLSFLLFSLVLGGYGASQHQNGIWLDVPYVRQSEEGCGSAAISMILQYWNAQAAVVEPGEWSAEAIQKKLYSPKAHGIFASDLEKYFKDLNFRTFAYQGQWEDLREHLVKGRPLIVGLQLSGKKSPLHYVVVTGMDWAKPAVLVNDPARGRLLRIERADFEKTWQPVRNWMLLAVPQHAN